MTENVDHSDRLALESALISLLTDFDPDGDWQHHTLYQRRVKRPYGGLNIGEMDDLLDHLHDSLEPARKHWLATQHQAKEQTDAQDSSHLPAPTPLA